jgi:GWxTD domain-containing protein
MGRKIAEDSPMLSIWPVVLLAGLLPFGGDEEAKPFPVDARGDIRFEMDGARFSPGSTGSLDLYIAIPVAPLAESPDSAGYAQLSLALTFKDVKGDEVARVDGTSWVPLATSAEGGNGTSATHVLTLRPAAPGTTSQVRLRIEDLNGRKKGIMDRARKKKPWGEAIGRFVGDPLSVGLSDVAFAWDLDRSEANAGAPVRMRLIPNPSRFYGLFHTSLLFYVERYEANSAQLRYRILRVSDGRIVASGADSSGSSSGGTQVFLLAADLSSIPAGLYRLAVQGAGGDSSVSGGNFQVLWETASWTRDEKALLEEAFVLLPPAEYERVQEMSRGEVEVYMRDLWYRNDPNPGTGVNELHDRFMERVEHADQFYVTALRRGMLSDRGRVYIRFGPPDEITKELNPQDQNLISNVLPSETVGDSYNQVRGIQARNPRDDRAYEIWTYQVRGDPLFPDMEEGTQRTGLKFIFVDDLGYGDMRLVYTNLSGAF